MIRSRHIVYDSAGKPKHVICADGSLSLAGQLAGKTAKEISQITGWWSRNPRRMLRVGLKPRAARGRFYNQPRKENRS